MSGMMRPRWQIDWLVTSLARVTVRTLLLVKRVGIARSINSEKREATQILAGPQRHPGATIDGLDLDHLVRIGEIDPTRRAGICKRVEQHVIEKALFRLRRDDPFEPSAMQTDVKACAGQIGKPTECDNPRFAFERLAAIKRKTLLHRHNVRDKVEETRLFGDRCGEVGKEGVGSATYMTSTL
jgi:hypothetical protein